MFYQQKLSLFSVAVGLFLVLALTSATSVSAQPNETVDQTQIFLPIISNQANASGQTDTHQTELPLAQSNEAAGQTQIFLPIINNQASDAGQLETDSSEQDYMIIEGDIQVSKDFFSIMASNANATFNTQFWPNGIVPFEFDANVTVANQGNMLAAMNEWESVANVDFQQCSQNKCSGDFVHIQNATANNSPAGKQGGRQVINIFNWDYRFIIAHELAHTLGFLHEQSRPDRDTFVQIIPANIENGKFDGNFNLIPAANHYGPYDFDSVMHYGRCAFSTISNCPNSSTAPSGGRTIVVREPYSATWGAKIGQRDHLSTMDKLTMSFLYPRANWRFSDRNYTGTQDGTFLKPYQTFTQGVNQTPIGGTLWVQPGAYAAVGTYTKAMTIQAPLGGVTLGQ